MAQEILSAGIDIGTTTSQVIFSRLRLEDNSYTAVPDVKITQKEVLYRSPVYFTPLGADGNIDAQALDRLLLAEYARAKVKREDISTGAVIITGESSRKQNARLAVERLSAAAGDFVVAAAGPDLESVLAGYGAGAADYSGEYPTAVANFDIGGGTTNVAVFLGGELQDAFALDIGGRLVRLNPNHCVTYLSPRIEPLIASLGLSLQVGRKAELGELIKLAETFADICRRVCLDEPLTKVEQKLYIGHGKRPGRLSAVMFSGGVAEYIKDTPVASWDDILRYGDIGPLVGAAFWRVFSAQTAVQLLNSRERIRATVIGAGSYAVRLSGSTVTMDDGLVPLTNVPVIRLEHPERPKALMQEYRLKRAVYPPHQQVAIALAGPAGGSYEALIKLADGLLAATAEVKQILLVVMEQDFAKALGLLLKHRGRGRQVICLDRIHAQPGDYIDVGRSVAGTVPVVVKTLIFKS